MGGERPPDYLGEDPFADPGMRAERIAAGGMHADRERPPHPTDAGVAEPPATPARARGDRWASARSAIPATLAALAEAGLIFLVARSTVVEATGAATGPIVEMWAFVAAFTVMVSVGALFRGFRFVGIGFAAAGVGLTVAQAGSWTGAKVDGATVLLVAIVATLVAFRAATLALRDWNDPAGGAFAWGAFLLLGAVLVGSHGGFEDALPVVVPLFFVGHLASRTAVVLLYGAPAGGPAGVSGRIVRLAGLGLAVLVAAFIVLGPVGRRTGALGFLARMVDPIVSAIAAALVWVLVQIATPILWLADKLTFDVEGVRRLLERLGDDVERRGQTEVVQEGSSIERLIALALLVTFVVLIVWAIKRQRDRLERLAREAEELPETTPLGARPRTRTRGGRRRRELPAETVRRWYAEALIALEDKGLERDPTWTPAELLERATDAFPDASSGLRALTRAYERVRYGAATLDQGELDALDRARREAVAALRRSPSLEPTATGDVTS